MDKYRANSIMIPMKRHGKHTAKSLAFIKKINSYKGFNFL